MPYKLYTFCTVYKVYLHFVVYYNKSQMLSYFSDHTVFIDGTINSFVWKRKYSNCKVILETALCKIFYLYSYVVKTVLVYTEISYIPRSVQSAFSRFCFSEE